MHRPQDRGGSDHRYRGEILLGGERQISINTWIKAHPGWRQIKDVANDPAERIKDSDELPMGEDDDWTAEPGTPDGMKLIKWFYKTHPRKARRIKRDFERRLWEGRL